ncbi:MAG: hypothetical protein KDC35_03835 [Acidobacteria bacterium]|nr:hypothetical protein [Acidobacteriota bacterium]
MPFSLWPVEHEQWALGRPDWPKAWRQLAPALDISQWMGRSELCPVAPLVFNAFHWVPPERIKVVLLGEEPYPRVTSACGVAFWDRQHLTWDQPIAGNCSGNILKALAINHGFAEYGTPLCEVRTRLRGRAGTPTDLFRYWMQQGVLLMNASLTYTSHGDRRAHHKFWRAWTTSLLRALSEMTHVWFVAWGRKAQACLQKARVPQERVIAAGHPTYFHQFCDSSKPRFSPFQEIETKTGFSWLYLDGAT